jgi:AcrR family transcriptional regulator
MSSAGPRPLRKDAERNLRRILDAATEVFATRGLAVTMDDVAHHAGVGVGTVYRRFANKDELIEALFVEQIEALAELGREGLALADPWEGFVFFMQGALDRQARDRALKQLLFESGHGQERVAHARDTLAPVVTELVERARAAGQMRPDVEGQDTPVMQMMLATVVDFSRDVEPELWRRFLAIVLDGLRARPGQQPLPRPALDEAQLDAAMGAWRGTSPGSHR